MKIATWNVNSIRVRLEHIQAWLQAQQPDVLCLQETKTIDENFPAEEFAALGYHLSYCGQKTFNGVAMISRLPLLDVVTAFPTFDDPQRRVLAATVADTRIIDLYVPNGSEVGSEKYTYKLNWLRHLKQFLQQELKQHEKVVVVGDFNIAPRDEDVHDPEKWAGKVLVSDAERAALQEIIDLGFIDVFCQFEQEQIFSWWDYRAAAFRRNRGLRIDLILASVSMAKSCQRCFVDVEPRKLERPSDHAPVLAEFA